MHDSVEWTSEIKARQTIASAAKHARLFPTKALQLDARFQTLLT